MPVVSIIAIYFVLWWLCLFMILPIGARSQADAGEIVAGTEPGAPAVLKMWRKLLATTILAAALLGLLLWGLSNPVLQQYWR